MQTYVQNDLVTTSTHSPCYPGQKKLRSVSGHSLEHVSRRLLNRRPARCHAQKVTWLSFCRIGLVLECGNTPIWLPIWQLGKLRLTLHGSTAEKKGDREGRTSSGRRSNAMGDAGCTTLGCSATTTRLASTLLTTNMTCHPVVSFETPRRCGKTLGFVDLLAAHGVSTLQSAEQQIPAS